MRFSGINTDLFEMTTESLKKLQKYIDLRTCPTTYGLEAAVPLGLIHKAEALKQLEQGIQEHSIDGEHDNILNDACTEQYNKAIAVHQ